MVEGIPSDELHLTLPANDLGMVAPRASLFSTSSSVFTGFSEGFD
jgi:hypothetical protein